MVIFIYTVLFAASLRSAMMLTYVRPVLSFIDQVALVFCDQELVSTH